MSAGLPRKEQEIVGLLATELFLLPWALGGNPFWSRLLCLLLSTVALLLALHPTELGSHPFRRLGKSTVAWSCAALLLYFTLQALNPSLLYQTITGTKPSLSALSHVEFLPAGLDSSDPSHEGSWRQMVFPVAVMFSGLSVSFGLRRRSAVESLLVLAALNSGLVAIHGIATRLLAAPAIFWLIPCDTDFIASFPYRNHAAAFYYLHCGLCIALAANRYQHHRREGRGLLSCLAFCGLALLLALAAVLTKSRTAVVMIGLLFCGTPVIAALYSWIRTRWLSTRRIILLGSICLGGILATLGGAYFTTVNARFAELLGGRSYSIAAREAGATATLELARQAPVYGHGLGSFPLLFEPFQRRHPAIEMGGSFSQVWPHAHNDYVEALIEIGMLGCLPLALILCFWLIGLLKQRIWNRLPASILLFSCCLVLLHAAFEYLFSNPSLLMSFTLLAACVLRHSHISLEREKERALTNNLR